MNLGMLKLYKLLLIIIVSVIFLGCSLKDYYKKELIPKKNIETSKKENIVKKTIDISKKIKKKVIIKKDIIQSKPKKIVVKPKVKKIIIKKDIIQLEPKKIVVKPKIKKIIIKKDIIQLEPKKIVVRPKVKKVILKPKKKITIKPKVEKTTPNEKLIIKKHIIKNNKKYAIQQSTTLHKKNLQRFDFNFIQKGIPDNNTFLVVGGIQGDEPGSFVSASILSTHYQITKGSVWVIPNLNFYSILKRSRGPFGDMNRKFAKLSKNDPEFKIIQRIKKYITNPNVKLILNLHDGSGYYRPMFIDKGHQPEKWGQSIVIDQEVLPGVKHYGDTYVISEEIANHLNNHLLNKEHEYRTKNTHTRFKKSHEEQEMSKSLTYYAVRQGKSAFGHETSKDISIVQRIYYKLLAIEKFMELMGIEYKRDFPLTTKGIKHAMDDDVSVTFTDTNINLPLKNLRTIQKYFPINKNGIINYISNNPLVKIIKHNNIYTIFYGNRRMTKLEADYSQHLNLNTKVKFKIDGKSKSIKFGDTITVKNKFLVVDDKKFRVNVIGYKHRSGIETNKNIYRKNFIKRYSLDRGGKIFRVEFYKNKNFAGMVLVKYLK